MAEEGRFGRDQKGTSLPTLESARLAAVELLGQVLRDQCRTFWNDPDLKLTVRSDDDLILMRLTEFGTLAPASR